MPSRGQFERPVMMIMMVIVVSLVLYIGYLGIFSIIDGGGERAIDRFWNELSREISTNQNYGARKPLSFTLPQGEFICFLNLDAPDIEKKCDFDTDILSYNIWPAPALPVKDPPNLIATGVHERIGKDMCDRIERYFTLAGSDEPNVILSTGLNYRIDPIAVSSAIGYDSRYTLTQASAHYLCVRGPRVTIHLEGLGRATRITVP